MSKFVDYKALKQAVSMVQILDRYGLRTTLRQSGDSLSGACPIHGGHNKTQFRVSVSKNCWNCFGKCKRGGNIIDFVALKEGIGFRDAALLIQEWFGLTTTPEAECGEHKEEPKPTAPQPAKQPITSGEKPESEEGEGGENKPLGFELKHLEPAHPYLAERKLSAETITAFGLGYCSKGTMAGRIAIPIHNVHGELVAYVGRWPGEPPSGQGRYKLPKGFRKSLEVFNLHRAAAENAAIPLVVVEGPIDCMWLWQAGIRKVVSIMGSSLSLAQETLLVNAVGPEGKIILFFDGDDAGVQCAQNVLARIAPHCFIRWVKLPNRKQPTDCSPDDLGDLFGLASNSMEVK